MLTNWEQLGLHNSIQGHGIDRDAWALSDNDNKRTLELKVDEKSNVVGALLTLRQLSEDQEAAPPSATAGEPHTLPDSSHWLKIALCHTTGAHDPERSQESIGQEDVGDNDGNGKDPLGNLERYLRLYLTGPFIEGEEVDGGEGIGGVDGAGDENENPEPGVG